MKRSSQAFYILIQLLFLIPGLLYCQTEDARKLMLLLKEIEKDTVFSKSNWGVSVMRVSDGRLLAAQNENQSLIPASAIKIAITYPAWKILGRNYRFETRVECDGEIVDSTLHGNIYLKGSGDPTLGSWRFRDTDRDAVFAKVYSIIKNAGIQHVAGAILADPECFSNELVAGSWTWEDIGNYYGAGVCGLNIHENLFEIIFKPSGHEGDPARIIRLEPPVRGIDLENEVTTGPVRSGDQVVVYGGPSDEHRVLKGTVPAGVEEFTVKASLPDPPLQAVQWLQQSLIINGISFGEEATSTPLLRKRGVRINQNRNLLGSLFSPTLEEIIQLVHEKSINVYADALLLQLGSVLSGDGSYVSGCEAVINFWKAAGINVTGWVLKDGSGLSLANRIGTRQLAEIMRYIVLDDKNGKFVTTLNMAGKSGDLKDLFSSGRVVNNLHAKSGYMKTVRSYVGTVKNIKSERLAFCFIVNYSGKEASLIKSRVKNFLEALGNLEGE